MKAYPCKPKAFDEIVSHTALREQYKIARTRLRAFGLPTNGNDRLSAYDDLLAELGPMEARELRGGGRLKDLANALCESSMLVDIATLPDDFLDQSREKIRHLTRGPIEEDINKDDPGRNFACELHAAARCNSLGRLGPFPETRGDFRVAIGRSSRPVEVKRISSIRNVRSLTKKAAKQLAPTIRDAKWGCILLDVSAAARSPLGFIDARSPEEFANTADAQMTAFYGHYIRTLLDHKDVVREGGLGLLFRHVAYGWAGGPQHVRRSIVVQATTFYEKDALFREFRKRGRAFEEIAAGIEGGLWADGSDEKLAKAMGEIALPDLKKRRRGR